jgi:hypothetical protein
MSNALSRRRTACSRSYVQAADQRVKEPPPEIAHRALHARHRSDLVLLEKTGGYGDDRNRQGMVSNPGQARQGNRQVGFATKPAKATLIVKAPSVKASRRVSIRPLPYFRSLNTTVGPNLQPGSAARQGYPAQHGDVRQVEIPGLAEVKSARRPVCPKSDRPRSAAARYPCRIMVLAGQIVLGLSPRSSRWSIELALQGA